MIVIGNVEYDPSCYILYVYIHVYVEGMKGTYVYISIGMLVMLGPILFFYYFYVRTGFALIYTIPSHYSITILFLQHVNII